MFWKFCAFFWVIPRRMNFICQSFGTRCVFHLHRWIGMKNGWGWGFWGIYRGKVFGLKIFESNNFQYKYPNILNPSHSSHLPAYEAGTECSETLAYTIQTPGNYPEESIQCTWYFSHIIYVGLQKGNLKPFNTSNTVVWTLYLGYTSLLTI